MGPFMALALLGTTRRDGLGVAGYLWTMLGAYLFAISNANPIMGRDFRLVLAAFPLVYLLTIEALNAVAAAPFTLRRMTGVLAFQGFLLLWIMGNPVGYLGDMKAEKGQAAILKSVHIPVGEWLRDYQAEHGKVSVALADAGATAFYSGCEIIDFYGLNDMEFAREKFSADRLLRRSPEFVLVKSESAQRFVATDSLYGRMSSEIMDHPEFETGYERRGVWSHESPFYSLWLYQRISGPQQAQRSNIAPDSPE
jgi:hypothetical protein